MDDLSRYFEILEVPRGASLEEIKRAYRDLAQVWHPDRYGHNPRLRSRAEEKLKSINEAYQRLSAGLGRAYTYSPSQSSPTPNPPAPQRHRPETQPEPPPQSPKHSAPSTTSPRPSAAAHVAADPPPKSETAARILAFATIAVIGFGILILAKPQPRGDTNPSSTLRLSQPASSAPLSVATAYEQLDRVKARIRARVIRKDAEFDRLQQWYRRGVSIQDEAAYRAALDKAQREEQDLAALILTYNATKKALDARSPVKEP